VAAVGYTGGDPTKVDVAGDTMTGDLLLVDGSPAASEDYVADHAGGGGGAVTTVFTRSGDVTAQTGDYTAAQVGADPAGTAAAAVATHSADTTAVHGITDTAALETTSGATAKVTAHTGASDPHGDRAAASGALTAHTAAADPHGDRAYTDTAVQDLADTTTTALAGKVSTGDSRLTDARTPTAHAASHASAGSDPVTPAAIGAATTAHNHAGSDITSGTVPYAQLPVGAIANTVAAGNDSRLTDTRTPTDGTVTNAKVASGAAIALSKLATDPLARANHTGSQAAATISDLAATVQAYRLDQFAVPTADLSLNTHSLTNVGGKNSLGILNLVGVRASAGPPSTGTWALGDTVIDSGGLLWICSTGGTPGTWVTPTYTIEDPRTFTFARSAFNAAGSDLWENVVNGQRTGYANEGGELRSRAYSAARVAFRCQSHSAGDGTSVHIIEACLSDNTVEFYVTALGDGGFTRDLAVGRNLTVTGTASAAGLTSTAGITNSGGAIAAGSQRITGVTDPSSAQDAATRNYVDSAAYGTWTNFPSLGTNVTLGTPSAQYRTAPGNMLQLRGQLAMTGSVATNFTMSTLPFTFAAARQFNVRVIGLGANVFVNITTGGALSQSGTLANGHTMNFDGIEISL